MWYNLTPAQYANGLRFYAEGNDVGAIKQRAEGKPWSEREALRAERAARRLRAMALLCDLSTAERAGDIDFLGMDHPNQTHEEEDRAVATAEAMSNQPGSS